MIPLKRDYLFVYPYLLPIGGAEAAAAWMLEALLERGSVTLVTTVPPALEDIDRWCGTNLAQASLDIRIVCWWLSRTLERLGQPHELWRFRYFLRKVRQERANHRFCVSSFNDLDMGAGYPAFQYLHDPPCNDPLTVQKKTRTRSSSPWAKRALYLYRWVAELFAPWSNSRVARNMTVANSNWTSERFAQVYGRPADQVLYPPPLGHAQDFAPHDKPWFMSLARAEHRKGWDDALEIVGRLRELGHPVGLSMFALPGQEGYLEYLKQRTTEHPDWLNLRINAPREEIDQAIASHRFGLSASREEPYGMAVAELLLGGCLTAVRDVGGQTEIVTEPELRFKNVNDAVTKLDRVLRDSNLLAQLKASQQSRRTQYTREVFLERFHACLDKFEAAQRLESG